MYFVDDRIGERARERFIALPIEIGIVDNDAFRKIGQIGKESVFDTRLSLFALRTIGAEYGTRRKCFCARIEKVFIEIEPIACRRIVRSVDAIQIERSRFQTLDKDVPHVAGFIDLRIEFDCIAKRFCIGRVEKIEGDARGIFAEQRKVHAAVRNDGAALHRSAC